MKSHPRAFVFAGLSSLVLSGAAFAQGTVTQVEFPVDPAELGTVIATAGATILLIAFSIGLGFVLVRKLMRRLSGKV